MPTAGVRSAVEALVESSGCEWTFLRSTGHPARTYREWVTDHVSDFAPPTEAEAGASARRRP